MLPWKKRTNGQQQHSKGQQHARGGRTRSEDGTPAPPGSTVQDPGMLVTEVQDVYAGARTVWGRVTAGLLPGHVGREAL